MTICAMYGCRSRSNSSAKANNRDPGTGMFNLPKVITWQCERTRQLSEKRRREWLALINRQDLKNLNNIRVCGRHFISGKPAALMDYGNPDWAPSQLLGHGRDSPSASELTERYNRRRRRSRKATAASTSTTDETSCAASVDVPQLDCGSGSGLHSVMDCTPDERQSPSCSADHGTKKDAVTQTDLTMNDIATIEVDKQRLASDLELSSEQARQLEATLNSFNTDNQRLATELRESEKQKEQLGITESSLRDDNGKVMFYTGVSNFSLLMAIFHFIEVVVNHTSQNSLAKFQEFVIFLMKLKWNFPLQDLAYRFGVSQSTASRILEKWLHASFWRLRSQIVWPSRKEIQKTMPQAFVDSFGTKVAVVLDCFEIKIERPSSLLPRSETWSQYKGSNTAKFLIGITPQGVIAFISEGWGGRTSDKHITEQCGILDKLTQGDVVLADRGFDIADSVGLYCATLHIPAFTKGKSQLSALDVARTRKLANVRIHVERVIGLVRNKFTIMKSIQPIDFVLCKQGDEYTALDKIVTVCCVLTNLCPSVVPENTVAAA